MIIAIYLLLAVLLLALNAFFVLAEFAAVKMRPSRTDELIAQGNPRASLFKHIQSRLDEYLSVCQVGITFASIGLGFVGDRLLRGPVGLRELRRAQGQGRPAALQRGGRARCAAAMSRLQR